MPFRLMDTNILIRYYTRDIPDRANKARRLLQRVDRGEERVATTLMVLFETAFTLQRSYGVARQDIERMVADVVSMPGVQLAGKALFLKALALYARTSLSLADAYNAAFMQANGLTEIYTWDTDFDAIPGINRVEPNGPVS